MFCSVCCSMWWRNSSSSSRSISDLRSSACSAVFHLLSIPISFRCRLCDGAPLRQEESVDAVPVVGPPETGRKFRPSPGGATDQSIGLPPLRGWKIMWTRFRWFYHRKQFENFFPAPEGRQTRASVCRPAGAGRLCGRGSGGSTTGNSSKISFQPRRGDRPELRSAVPPGLEDYVDAVPVVLPPANIRRPSGTKERHKLVFGIDVLHQAKI